MAAFWAVELLGEAADLNEVERALHPSFDPRVQTIDGRFSLRSAEFDALHDAKDVRDRARVIIDVLNGAVALRRGAEPVRGGVVLRVNDDGRVDVTVFAEAAVRLRMATMTATAIITNRDGNVIPPPPPTPTLDRSIRISRPDNERLDGKVKMGSAKAGGGSSRALKIGKQLDALTKTKPARIKLTGAKAFLATPMDFDKRQRAVVKLHYFKHAGGGAAGQGARQIHRARRRGP